jgi:hypothetical protein
MLLDQITIHVGRKAFEEILAWMDAEPSNEEIAGMKRLLAHELDWARDRDAAVTHRGSPQRTPSTRRV